MRLVSNEEFELAWNNKDNRALINSIIKKYQSSIPHEYREEISMVALWRCLGNHDPNIQKFTSSLYRYANWECLKYLKKDKIKTKQLSESICYHENHEYIDLLMSLEPKDKEILEDYFCNRLHYKEIAKKHNKSKQWASSKVKSIIAKIKMDDGV